MTKKKEKKWAYAIVRSVFGNLWVGKTHLEPNDIGIFSDFEYATGKAQDLNPSHENWVELDETDEEDAEEISKGIEKFIISG